MMIYDDSQGIYFSLFMGDPGPFFALFVRKDEHFSSFPMHLFQTVFFLLFFPPGNMKEISTPAEISK